MAEMTVSEIVIAGVTKAALAAVSSVDTFDNDGKTFIEIANGSGGTITATFAGQVSLQHGIAADEVVSIPDGETWVIGPFPERFYNTDGANEVQVTYSGTTSVTAAAYSVADVHA